MGQAKLRGTFAQRISQAQSTQLSQEPINVPCKTCKDVLNGFALIEHSSAGAAWQKTCICGAITVAVVQATNSSLVRAFKSSLDVSKKAKGSSRKMSVTFIEKTIDSIETGLIRF